MPSSNKTPLGLNQWIGQDKPKKEDFNADNLITDTELSRIDTALSSKFGPSIPGAINWDSGTFDIEVGNWNPVLSGATSGTYPNATTSATYCKLGPMTYITCTSTFNTLTAVSGNLLISGFPFPVIGSNFIPISVFNNLNSRTNIHINLSATAGYIMANTGGSFEFIQGSNVSLNASQLLRFSGWYRTN